MWRRNADALFGITYANPLYCGCCRVVIVMLYLRCMQVDPWYLGYLMLRRMQKVCKIKTFIEGNMEKF